MTLLPSFEYIRFKEHVGDTYHDAPQCLLGEYELIIMRMCTGMNSKTCTFPCIPSQAFPLDLCRCAVLRELLWLHFRLPEVVFCVIGVSPVKRETDVAHRFEGRFHSYPETHDTQTLASWSASIQVASHDRSPAGFQEGFRSAAGRNLFDMSCAKGQIGPNHAEVTKKQCSTPHSGSSVVCLH